MEFVSGNIFVREMRFEKAGDQVVGHAHNFDHTTYVARGALRVERLRKVGEKEADGELVPIFEVERAVEKRAADGLNWILIRAGVQHRITALEPHSIGHCVYAHRNP